MTRLDVRLVRRVSPGFTIDAAFAFDFGAAGAGAGGTIAALFGPSGCGKTTTLAMIAGLAAPDEGRVALGDEVLVDTARGISVAAECRGIAIVAQDALLFPHLDVAGNLAYAERRARGRARPSRDEVVSELGLDGLLPRSVGALSGGERQRVALGRALLSGPRLLLLDEPVSALDEAARWEVLGFVERVTRRFAVPALYVSHQRSEVLRLAQAAARMESGRIVASGPAESVIAATSEPGGVPNVLRAEMTGEGDGVAAAGHGVVLHVPWTGRKGDVVWCRIGSGVIALERPDAPSETSARNHLPGRIVAVETTPGRVRATIDAGIPLVADVTPEAARQLALVPGAEVVCVFKVHAIEVLGGGVTGGGGGGCASDFVAAEPSDKGPR